MKGSYILDLRFRYLHALDLKSDCKICYVAILYSMQLIHPKLGCMEYSARVCNHKPRAVCVVTHEFIILIQPSLRCINWFVAQYMTQVQGECR